MKYEPLTGLELQLCELVSEGLTIRQAADKMYRSHKTLAGYRENVFEKLGCHSMTHAISILFRKGVLK